MKQGNLKKNPTINMNCHYLTLITMYKAFLPFLFILCVVLKLHSQNAGDLDLTFSSDGKALFDIASGADNSYASTLQSDGKILLTGNSVSGQNSDISLIRLNNDGQLDVGFGTGGKIISDFGSNYEYSRSIVLQPDGKIVVGGFRWNSWNYDFILIRYLPNGMIDSSFGSNGISIIDLIYDDKMYDLKILPDGKFLTVGYAANISNQSDVAIVKFNSDGSLDNTFGTNGKVFLSVGSSSDFGYTLAVQSDGKFIVSGYFVISGTNHEIYAARYNSNGSLDTSFGTNGIAFISVGIGKDEIYSSAIQQDGKIVLGGFSMYNNYFSSLIIRLNCNGAVDPSFGTNGKMIKSIGPYDDYGRTIIVQPDNKIIISGTTNLYSGSGYGDFFLFRVNQDGTDDQTFGISGIVTTQIGTANDDCYSSLLQTDSKLILSGFSSVSSFSQFSIARYFGECEVPSQTSTISGNTNPCQGSQQAYSVTNVSGVTYEWSLPAGSIINSGQGTNSITATIGNTPGSISVVPSNTCGNGPVQTLDIVIITSPTQPSPITGNTYPCQGSTQTYSVTNIAGVSYIWTVPAGWSITNGQNSNSITVTVGNSSGNISVTPTNSCGNGTDRTLAITINTVPAQPSMITGNAIPCQSSSQVYSVTNVASVTYTWAVPSGSTITTGQGTNSVTVTIGAASGNISVTPENSCGNGSARTLAITVNTVPAQPSVISGSASPCQGSSQVYSVTNVSGVTYAWTVPSGSTITAGLGTNSVTVTIGAVSGNISVTPSNSCGNGTARTLAITSNYVTANAGTAQTINYGQTAQLDGTVTGTGTISILWTANNSSWTSTLEDPITDNLTMTTQFTIAVSNQYGCMADDDMIVNVNGGALTVIANSYPDQICQGESSQLNALASGGTGSYTYNWTSNPQGFNSTLINPEVWPEESTEYTVIVSDGVASESSSVLVDVTPLPLPMTQPSGPDTVDLHEIGSSIFTSGTVIGAITYEWLLAPTMLGTLQSNDTSCIVTWSGTLGIGQIKVRGVGGCGAGEWSPVKEVTIENMTSEELAVKDFKCKLYPNPASSYLSIASSSPMIKVQINNLTGQTVALCYLSHPSCSATISTTSLKAAIYLVTITTIEGHFSNRIAVYH